MFLHHLYHLDDSALAKEVVKIQTDNGLPGIVEECNNFLVKFGILNISDIPKEQFKRIVKSKVRELNNLKLTEQVKNRKYKKIDYERFASDTFNCKS